MIIIIIKDIKDFGKFYELIKDEIRAEKICYNPNRIRDRRGRLKKGAKIAEKGKCDREEIWRLHTKGKTVREIVEIMQCSKSTVYDTIKQKNVIMYLLHQSGWFIPRISSEMQCTDNFAMQGIREIARKGIPASILEKIGVKVEGKSCNKK